MAWKTEGVCSTKAGSRLENTRKNRYKDIVPCKSVGILRESVLLAQMLGGSAHLAAPTDSQPLPSTLPSSPQRTPPQIMRSFVLEVVALLPEATRGQIPTRVQSPCLLLPGRASET